jgi:PAS domain S-box-containing protein
MPLDLRDQTFPVNPSSGSDATALYAALLETIGDAVIFTDMEGRIQFWNRGAARIFGYTADEVVGQTPAILYPEEAPERFAGDLERIMAGQDFAGEWRGRRRDGSNVWIEVRTTLVRDPAGTPIGFLGVSKDITERKRVDATLLRHEILEVVARLSAGVAHEANNQMSIVLGLASFLLGRTDLADSARQDVSRIQQAAQRTAEITRQLLAFTRQQPAEPRVLDLNTSVLASQARLQSTLGNDIELHLALAPELPPVRLDEGQLQQVLLILARNARDAMPGTGRLTLETREVEISETTAPAEATTVQPGSYVELVVRDTGVGMDPQTLTHLFQPFFTTKRAGRATGLGLASLYGIVRQSSGYVFAESSRGAGACFRILLPIASDTAIK